MFDIQKDSQIVLYGYSQFDTVQYKYEKMQKLGYQMLGYLDQRADEMKESMNIPCWTTDTFPYDQTDRKNIIVILLLQNGRLHEGVAEGLCNAGFEKILFLPQRMVTSDQKQMFQKYNSFLKDEYETLKEIPMWKDVSDDISLDKDSILRYGEKNLTVSVPAEMLFVYALEDGGEANICFSEIYSQIFDVLEGKTFVCDRYCEFMGADTEEKKKKLLADRAELYSLWEHHRHCNTDYFAEAAPIAVWNERGYFNIIDGHHRVMYQVRKGYKKIPVSIKYKDYECWNISLTGEEVERLKTVHVPIPHPNFLNESSMYENHWWKVIDYLYKISHGRSYRFVEIDDYMGYYSGVFQRIVKGNALVVLKDESERALCREMQRCMHQKIDVVGANELVVKGNDILYLKFDDRNMDYFLRLMKEDSNRHIIMEIQQEKREKLFAKILEIFPGRIVTIGQYYRGDAYIICAIEKECG